MRTQAPVRAHGLLGERNHVLLLLSTAFLCGCVCAPWLRPGLWLWAVCLLAGLLIALLRRLGARTGLALALCCFALGALRTHGALPPAQVEPGSYEISGFVYGGAALKSDGRIAFTLGDIVLDGAPAPGRAYCTLHYDEAPPELFDGAQVRFTGRVYLPDGKSGPPHMDFSLWMRQNGMRFGVAAYRELEVLNTPAGAPVRDAAYRARETLGAALERVMGEEARVAMALLLGQREGLSDQELQAFRTLGVAHVMSVSGLHVGLLGGALLWLLERLRVRRGIRLCALS
ncbi:MAG: ComEC family competence protein, partial [Clostridiales bacterium]|nr:ComEC family competence protein [Clostridiales bacterium]